MAWLQRRKPKKMGVRKPDRIICRGHLQWVAGFRCLIEGKTPKSGGEAHVCFGRIDPHHVRTRGAGGGDEQVVPLCRRAHDLLDSPGWSSPRFEAEFGVDMTEEAARLWQRDRQHRIPYEARQQQTGD